MTKFKKFNYFDSRERKAVKRVIRSGELSGFYGNWGAKFLGGKEVVGLERNCEEFFGTKNAVSFNSLASGLSASIGALGVEPGDEIILPPWTMSATAAAVLHWGGIPVFCDVDSSTYCINPDLVESLITPKTKGILAVDIFGQSANTEKLMSIASRHNLFVISDSAQAIGAMRNNRFAGTLTHVGGISLNYHKHIHSGEGAVMFTNDGEIALRLQLIRNHAESVIGDIPNFSNLVNMVGHNYRMTEMCAAIASEQLKKLPRIIAQREEETRNLVDLLKDVDEISLPYVDSNNTHVYYIFGMQLRVDEVKFSKHELVSELSRRGVPGLSTAYVNVHRLPLFQKKTAIGTRGFPWSYEHSRKNISYAVGICPVAEELQDISFFSFYINDYILKRSDISFIARTFKQTLKDLRNSTD